MKPSAMFVSCCRGGTTDEDALIAALENGQIAKAGLDVFETEPCDPNHPLLKMDNFIASPHAGAESPPCPASGPASPLPARRPSS